MNIYVASSWRNEYQPSVVRLFRQQGHEVYDFRNPAPGDHGFHWSEIDPEWKHWTPEAFRQALAHEIAQRGYARDREAMRWCDMAVLVLPAGRSAHLEAGWLLGNGRRVVIFAPTPVEPELMYLLAGHAPREWFACTYNDLLICVNKVGEHLAKWGVR